MKENKKKRIREKELQEDDLTLDAKPNYERHELIRVYAVKLTFEKVSFKQAIINECYFRKCVFKECDFSGAKISNSNFQGADFVGCNFKYTTFEKTQIGLGPLERNLPIEDNLKMHLAQSLKVNYASIGDYKAVNFAIKIELSATWDHLKKTSFSREPYYRDKLEYSGVNRFFCFLRFMYFCLFYYVWGNGETPSLMLISIPVFILLLSALFWMFLGIPFIDSLEETFAVFFNGKLSVKLGSGGTALLNVTRYVAMGLFVSSLVRRLSRR